MIFLIFNVYPNIHQRSVGYFGKIMADFSLMSWHGELARSSLSRLGIKRRAILGGLRRRPPSFCIAASRDFIRNTSGPDLTGSFRSADRHWRPWRG